MRSIANPISSGLGQAAMPIEQSRNSFAFLLAWTAAVLCVLCSQPLLQGEEPSRDARVPKFELDIQPILTARGCNSGPCHGKSRGQNGFSLSLLGFDADWDYRAIVEEGPTEDLIAGAAHPYTRLLIQAVPEHRSGARRARIRLPGDAQSVKAIPDGCRFHPRCPMARDVCRTTEPPKVAVGPGRWAACHFAGEVLATGVAA